jgi:hypothetical protein
MKILKIGILAGLVLVSANLFGKMELKIVNNTVERLACAIQEFLEPMEIGGKCLHLKLVEPGTFLYNEIDSPRGTLDCFKCISLSGKEGKINCGNNFKSGAGEGDHKYMITKNSQNLTINEIK